MKKKSTKQMTPSKLRKIAKLLYVFDWIADLVIISNVVCIVILLNNETSPQMTKWIEIFLDISLVVLFLELGVRMYYKRNFWRTPGDVFDLVVTTVCAVSLMPVSYTHLDVYKRQDEDAETTHGGIDRLEA